MKRIYKSKPSADLLNFIKSEESKSIKPIYEGGLDSKEEYQTHFFNLREQLVKEQGYICCYCQQRIDIKEGEVPKMKLEHFKPKDIYDGTQKDADGNTLPNLSLDYNNMLAACKGYANEETHCDSCKSGKELQKIPNLTDIDFNNFKINYIAYKAVQNPHTRKESDRWIKVKPLCNEIIKEAEKNNDLQKKNYLVNNDPLTGKKEGCLNLNHQTLMSRRFSNGWQPVFNIFYRKFGDKNWNTKEGKELASQIIDIHQKTDKDGYFKEFCQVVIDLLKAEFRIS